ncbi:hypothetical protein EGT74_02745 [Chitinophaga lutea]|uniref:Pectate lyase superfamily protein domain-containing protein n=1 Tax=Chitinophaga lutea TaxID=2488634 RepID=A0A3N4PX60_9BACT|nr:hypothetical protein [Chitinophaga lutea]RPE12488.1 hypothetical protein EGT74_02745 [Chitinophaga lutea]
MKFRQFALPALLLGIGCFIYFKPAPAGWQSKFVQQNKEGHIRYIPDAQGNTIPDFSRVGYYFGDRPLPEVAVVKTIAPTGTDNDQELIQSAIDEVSKRTPDKNGFRGALLLKKGRYTIPDRIHITAGGVVLRGEEGTVLVAASKKQVSLIDIYGEGQIAEIPGTRVKITDEYIPTGATSFNVSNARGFKPGDAVILFRPGTQQWITDIKMDQIESRGGTRQWQPKEYDLRYERTVVAVQGNRVTLDNPVVMPMETKYGGGELYKYTFDGRIRQVGVEDLTCESTFDSDTAENHAWDAVAFDKAEHGWVKGVTARYFGYSCVNLKRHARNITVTESHCFEHKSIITGSRRYSFNNSGQLNLFMDCHATDGRHDYVTGAITCGPNVFVNCTAKRTHADIGPHHRWASGTLYDNIVTDGDINIQDRGNWGSGHGWAGVTQVVWNCTVKKAAVQNPWASGKNYCIGLQGEKVTGRLKGRPDAEWEGQNQPGLEPSSLYFAQRKARNAGTIKTR